MTLSGKAESPSESTQEKSSYRWPVVISAFTMLLTLIPYLIGQSFADTRKFMWLSYNLDDSCVYLSWMRQAADGSWKALNLFTTDSQKGMLINPLFLLLGKFAALTHIPLIGVYHGSRILFGFVLLLSVWSLLSAVIQDDRTRKLAFLFVCFSSGLGWIPSLWEIPAIQAPIDTWQPEAITFLSLYLSPLFAFSLALQVNILRLLLEADRTHSYRPAVAAGMFGSLLGLTHSYDILSLFAVRGCYILFQFISQKDKKAVLSSLYRGIVFGLLTLPSVLYMYLQFQNDPVFRARANVPTLAPHITWVLLGYGVTMILAITVVVLVSRKRAGDNIEEITLTTKNSFKFLCIWMVVNILVSYLPHAAFQRKLMQGAHFPVAILAGVGASLLFNRIKALSSARMFWIAASVLTLFLSITNFRFVLRDIQNYVSNRSQTLQQRPYLLPGEIEALDWIHDNTPANTAIQPMPYMTKVEVEPGKFISYASDFSIACFTPGLIHRAVYCGHWGETPDYRVKRKEISSIGSARMSDFDRLELLKKMKVKYLVFSQKSASDESADDLMPLFRGRLPLPSYLKLIHSNTDADVYEIVL